MRPAFVLQMAAKPRGLPAEPVGIGFTASRKVGGAVARNRAKRRLRAAARAAMPGRVVPGFDYVLVARAAVLTCAFSELEADLRSALADLAKGRGRSSAPRTASSPPSATASIGC